MGLSSTRYGTLARKTRNTKNTATFLEGFPVKLTSTSPKLRATQKMADL